MNVFKKLQGLKTSTEFEDVIPRLEQNLQAAQQAVIELEARQEAAIFEDAGGGIEALRQRITQANDDVESYRIALAGARRRKDEAAKREAYKQLEAEMAAAAEVNETLLCDWKLLHKQALEFTNTGRRIQGAQDKVAKANRRAREAGRLDLVLSDHLAEMNKRRSNKMAEYYRSVGQPAPSSLIDVLGSPLLTMRIEHYWPEVPPDSEKQTLPPLAFLP